MENLSSKSLMIDDLVQKLEIGGHYRKYRITAIFGDNVECETSDGEVHTLSVNGIEPIPLTAGIIERNGFKNYRLSYDNGDYYYHIVLEDVKGGIWIEAMSSRNVLHGRKEYCGLINHIHELQHALRLCGIDKDIEP